MKYSSYRHYISTNAMKDSMEAYEKYHAENDSIYRAMPDEMKKQFIKVNYIYRFVID